MFENVVLKRLDQFKLLIHIELASLIKQRVFHVKTIDLFSEKRQHLDKMGSKACGATRLAQSPLVYWMITRSSPIVPSGCGSSLSH